jgi:hypothetical protein
MSDVRHEAMATKQRFAQIRHTAKRTASQAIPRSLAYRQGQEPNIFLFSSRRGGSTYLAGLIATERGMRMVDQPFDLSDFNRRTREIKAAHLPTVPLSQFISLSEEESETVRHYMLLLQNGGLRGLSSPAFSPKTRTILKILNASPLIDWFAENFSARIVYLVRHPIPQSLSVLKNKWRITLTAYLDHPGFSSDFLSEAQLREGRNIMETGSPLERAALNWIVENLYPLKRARQIDLLLTYEELVLSPTPAIDLVAERLNLHNVEGMYKRINVPSVSWRRSDPETNEAIRRNERQFLVSKWQAEVDDSARNRIQEILDIFDIHEYEAASPLPAKELCHFPASTTLGS